MATILITGANRGLGLAAARLLSEQNHTVLIAARNATQGIQAAQSVGGHFVHLDVTDPNTLSEAANRLADQYGKLDVLINNAAILLDRDQHILETDFSTLTQTLETNVRGVLNVTRALVPLLEQSSEPRIINVSSGAGQFHGETGTWAPFYSISKAALNMLTCQLAAALPGMAINAMNPGWCRTDMGGQEAPKSVDHGADTMVWLATEAPHHLTGRFFQDRSEIPW